MSGFDEIYREHVDGVFRYTVRLVGRRDVAEDITSEVFLELHRNFASLDPERLPAWLFTVAKNRARDYWRRQTLEQRFLAEAIKTTPTLEEPRTDRALFNNPALKPVHRVCLVLRYVYGMARNEIAAHTGLSETQVKGHLQYARQLLRAELGEEVR
jgi:RNA polymerase sigma-70 factor (ECF subfamily)